MNKENQKKDIDSSSIEEEPIQNLFPDVYSTAQLTQDKTLPIIRIINLPDTITTKDSIVDLEYSLPEINRKADIFLFVNKKKTDMFYQSSPGAYKFKNISLIKGENLLEIFYRAGSKKSISSYAVVYRE